MILESLWYHDGDGHENVAWKWICFHSISDAITPTLLLCQMQANSFWAEFPPKNHIQRQKKKENLAVACLHPP